MRWVMLGLLWPMARLIWYMGTRALLAMLAKVWRRPWKVMGGRLCLRMKAAKAEDNSRVTIGGIITGKVTKITRTNQMMAFITIEDLAGSVEVLVFPRDYEKNRDVLVEESKVFVSGRVSIGEDPVGKLICEKITPFEKLPKQVWLQFADKEAYDRSAGSVMECLKTREGSDQVVIWLAKERAKKILPANWNVCCDKELLEELTKILGEKNVRAVQKGLKV